MATPSVCADPSRLGCGACPRPPRSPRVRSCSPADVRLRSGGGLQPPRSPSNVEMVPAAAFASKWRWLPAAAFRLQHGGGSRPPPPPTWRWFAAEVVPRAARANESRGCPRGLACDGSPRSARYRPIRLLNPAELRGRFSIREGCRSRTERGDVANAIVRRASAPPSRRARGDPTPDFSSEREPDASCAGLRHADARGLRCACMAPSPVPASVPQCANGGRPACCVVRCIIPW